MLVLVAVCMPLFLIMAAFAIDLAWMQLVRVELRVATDAASRAAAKTLSLSQSEGAARAAARDAASRNPVAGAPLVLDDRQIEFGEASQQNPNARFAFVPNGRRLNAARVTGLRTQGSAAGPVGLFLGRVMGVSQFEPAHTATSTQLDRDLALVVDRSGSMMRELNSRRVPGGVCDPPHPTRSRWGALTFAVEGFVNELEQTPQNEQCGLASYSSAGQGCGFTFTDSDVNSGLAFDYQGVRDEMARLSSRAVVGRTNIHAGIRNGTKILTGRTSRPFAVRTMVVMTDGRHNTGPEPVIAARDAAQEEIVIHTVTFSSEADFRRMRDVADATGGRHYHAPDAAALEQIFREIARTLPVILTE